ncbi:hypothetical protein QL285_014404 [Trifolium repens]|nr:hypothetical protein QL285_014404 [Trifolium repens]
MSSGILGPTPTKTPMKSQELALASWWRVKAESTGLTRSGARPGVLSGPVTLALAITTTTTPSSSSLTKTTTHPHQTSFKPSLNPHASAQSHFSICKLQIELPWWMLKETWMNWKKVCKTRKGKQSLQKNVSQILEQ